jgi:hypothetical protein
MGAFRLGIWLFPFPRVRRAAQWVGRRRARRWAGQVTPRDVSWAVQAGSRIVPGATCLTQAFVGKAMLDWAGIAASLRIGVAKSDNQRFEAHAWVESGGRILVGHLKDLDRYAPLPPLPGESD